MGTCGGCRWLVDRGMLMVGAEWHCNQFQLTVLTEDGRFPNTVDEDCYDREEEGILSEESRLAANVASAGIIFHVLGVNPQVVNDRVRYEWDGQKFDIRYRPQWEVEVALGLAHRELVRLLGFPNTSTGDQTDRRN